MLYAVSLDTFVSNRNKRAQLSRKGIYFVVHQMNKKPGEQDPGLQILVMEEAEPFISHWCREHCKPQGSTPTFNGV